MQHLRLSDVCCMQVDFLLVAMFKAAFEFLRVFCIDNPRNQTKLAKRLGTDLELVLESLQKHDIGQWSLIAEASRSHNACRLRL